MGHSSYTSRLYLFVLIVCRLYSSTLLRAVGRGLDLVPELDYFVVTIEREASRGVCNRASVGFRRAALEDKFVEFVHWLSEASGGKLYCDAAQ